MMMKVKFLVCCLIHWLRWGSRVRFWIWLDVHIFFFAAGRFLRQFFFDVHVRRVFLSRVCVYARCALLCALHASTTCLTVSFITLVMSSVSSFWLVVGVLAFRFASSWSTRLRTLLCASPFASHWISPLCPGRPSWRDLCYESIYHDSGWLPTQPSLEFALGRGAFGLSCRFSACSRTFIYQHLSDFLLLRHQLRHGCVLLRLQSGHGFFEDA